MTIHMRQPNFSEAGQEPVRCAYINCRSTVLYDVCFAFRQRDWSVGDGCFALESCDWSIRCQPRPTRGDMEIRIDRRRTDGRY